MYGNTTLMHLLATSLQVEKHLDIDPVKYRKALHQLRQCKAHHTLYQALPKIMHGLDIKLSTDLTKDWEQMAQEKIDQDRETIIENIYTPNLVATFFITLCEQTLTWQCFDIQNEIQQTHDADAKRYLITSQLRHWEELFQINQEAQTSAAPLVRHSYTLLLAHSWSLIQLLYPTLYQAAALYYSQAEIKHYQQANDLAPPLSQLATHLASIRAATEHHRQTLQRKTEAPKVEEEKVYISVQEAADILKRDKSTVHRLYRIGELKNRIDDKNRKRYLKTEVEALAIKKNKKR